LVSIGLVAAGVVGSFVGLGVSTEVGCELALLFVFSLEAAVDFDVLGEHCIAINTVTIAIA
jgi:hypothetical protein